MITQERCAQGTTDEEKDWWKFETHNKEYRKGSSRGGGIMMMVYLT